MKLKKRYEGYERLHHFEPKGKSALMVMLEIKNPIKKIQLPQSLDSDQPKPTVENE